MPKLKLTHVAQVDGDDRYYIRFTASWDDAGQAVWHAFKDKLKQNTLFAEWDAKFQFNDGKLGGWHVSPKFLGWQKHEFSNYDEAMQNVELHEDPIMTWVKQAMRERRMLFIPPHVKHALQVLELPSDKWPSQDDLKKQYRAMAFNCHPDRTKDNGGKMKAVNNAKDALQDWLKKTTEYANF